MERQFVKIGQKEYPVINDGVLIGSWDEVPKSDGKTIQTITKDENDKELLDGIVIRGYETKFGRVNENGEVYEKDCLDEFIKRYFVDNKLNMPLDVQHDEKDTCGKVLYVEVNSTGFYFVAYVPREYPKYDWLKAQLRLGILQGFSKMGWATDWEYKYNADGSFSHEIVRKMQIISMSLVTTPANGVPFEKMQEVKNGLHFVNKTIEQHEDKPAKRDALVEMLN